MVDAQNKNIVFEEGRHHLSEEEVNTGYVLSCQTKVYEDIEVIIESTALQNKSLKILSEGQTFSYKIKNHITKRFGGEKTLVYGGDTVLGTEEDDTTQEIYGLSIDIGTTTVVAALINIMPRRR